VSPQSSIGMMAAMDFDRPLDMQTKITIQDIEPPIWRRILLPLDLNLAQRVVEDFHEGIEHHIRQNLRALPRAMLRCD